MSFIIVFIQLFVCIHSLNNGLALTPPMGYGLWNLYHRDWTSQVFYDVVDAFTSTTMKSVGYQYINVGGGWWYSKNGTIVRNSTGFVYTSPLKYQNNQTIENVIAYIHSHGLKYIHYTDAGTSACDGDYGMSEYYMNQDIDLFVSWGIDGIEVDSCYVEGNDTELIFEWRDKLNATNKSIAFSNCRNQCQNNVNGGPSNFQPWCVSLSNWWRVSTDIQSNWNAMLHNHDSTNSLGIYGQPGSWNNPDDLEIDIGDFKYDGTQKQLLMNQAHFSLWCIISSPLMAGNNLTNMSSDILNVLTNKDAIDINQNYLNNAGDIITEFNVTEAFRKEYEQQVIHNDNMTRLYYKPLPRSLNNSYAAFLFLNRDINNEHKVSVEFNQFPFVIDHNESLKCDTYDVWTKEVMIAQTQYNVTLPPQSVKFIRLFDCH